MAYTWSSGETILPPSYDEAVDGIHQVANGGNLSFVDFLPNCFDSGGIFSEPKFETFRTLIDRANEWLRSQPWVVKTCESVEFKLEYSDTNTQKMVYFEHGDRHIRYLRGLRLWIEPMNFENQRQQIGYMNLVPNKTSENRFFGSPSFENLSEVVDRFNREIQQNPVPGKILNVESQEMKVSSGEVLPDRTYWTEHTGFQRQYLFVLRVFFEISSPVLETINVIDFMPTLIKEHGLFTQPEYEPFSSMVNRVNMWCRQQTGIRICNAQSLELKIKSGNQIDTQRMSYTEHGSTGTWYIRILRLAYIRTTHIEGGHIKHDLPTDLTCKTFMPAQLTSGFCTLQFETLDETKRRVEAWIRATGARVISAETCALRLYTGGERKQGPEACYTYNLSDRSEHWIFIFRIYLNGTYHEPPAELLPPLPEIRDGGCCCCIV